MYVYETFVQSTHISNTHILDFQLSIHNTSVPLASLARQQTSPIFNCVILDSVLLANKYIIEVTKSSNENLRHYVKVVWVKPFIFSLKKYTGKGHENRPYNFHLNRSTILVKCITCEMTYSIYGKCCYVHKSSLSYYFDYYLLPHEKILMVKMLLARQPV